MKIVLDCPGCGKRYEVDQSLAGKKSRCRDCGNTFRIPNEQNTKAPADEATRKTTTISPVAAQPSEGSIHDRPPSVVPEVVATSAPPSIVPSGGARDTIVFNCPRCFKRYEVDRGLAGKKSRCKDCKEVFSIPAPMVAAVVVPEATEPAAKKPSLGARNFAVIPEEVVPKSLADLELEPVQAARPGPYTSAGMGCGRGVCAPFTARGLSGASGKEVATPASRHGRRIDGGVLVLGGGGRGAVALAVWHAALDPEFRRILRVFEVSFAIFVVVGMLLSFWANIWLLVIAFRDKLEQGLLVLLVPLYAIYYIFSRWIETRGILAMAAAPPVCVVLFLLLGGYAIGLKGPTMFVDAVRDRVESIGTDRPDPNRQEIAIPVYREYIRAMNRFTEELARIDPVRVGRMNPIEYQTSLREGQGAERDFVVAQDQARAVQLTSVDLLAVKKAVGAEMARRSSDSNIRSPGLPRSQRREAVSTASTPSSSGCSPPGKHRPTAPPIFKPLTCSRLRTERRARRPAAPPGGIGATGVPGSRRAAGISAWPHGARFSERRHGARFESFETHYERLRSQYGERAVQLVLSGLPTNTDPARGVTKRDVEDAIDKRLKALAPESNQSMSTGSGDKRSMCIAPVDDVAPGRSDRFRQGDAEWQQDRRCRVWRIYRVGAAAAGPAVHRRKTPVREEPKIPAALMS